MVQASDSVSLLYVAAPGIAHGARGGKPHLLLSPRAICRVSSGGSAEGGEHALTWTPMPHRLVEMRGASSGVMERQGFFRS